MLRARDGRGEEVPRPPLDLTPASLSAARSGRRARWSSTSPDTTTEAESPTAAGRRRRRRRRRRKPSREGWRSRRTGARALGPGRRRRAARTPSAPGGRSRDPAPPGRAAVRGAPRRVVVGAHPPSRLDAQAPAGGRIVKPLLPWVRSRPSSELLHRHEWPDAEWPAARRHAPPRGACRRGGNPASSRFEQRGVGPGDRSRSARLLRRRSPRRLRARVGLALDRILGAVIGAVIGALIGAVIGALSGRLIGR